MGVYFAARSGFVFLVVLTVLCQTNFVNGVDLDKRCGDTIDIGDSGGTLVSQSAPRYSSNVDCTVSLQSNTLEKQILLTFDRVNIDGAPPCTAGDVLEIFSGLSTDESDKLRTICGSTAPAEVTLASNGITLRFRTNNETQDAGFRIVYTAFSLGTCSSTEFKCENGRCIDENLKNNFNDNCGDSSDEFADLVKTVTGILRWGIAILIVIILAIVVAVILLCVCCGCLCYHCCCKSIPPPQTTTVVMSSPAKKYEAQYAI